MATVHGVTESNVTEATKQASEIIMGKNKFQNFLPSPNPLERIYSVYYSEKDCFIYKDLNPQASADRT